MFTLLLTYHRVIPEYLDYIFPFGKQLFARDFHFSGLRAEFYTDQTERQAPIPTLGRSGSGYAIAYSLLSVEDSPRQRAFPWSIRRATIYHSFDLETGKAFWIVTKGNRLIEDRIRQATESHKLEYGIYSNPSDALISSLNTQLLICDWTTENWRWYIAYLEDGLQAIKQKINAPLEKPPVENDENIKEISMPSPTTTGVKSLRSFSRSWSNKFRKSVTSWSRTSSLQSPKVTETLPDFELPTWSIPQDLVPSFSYQELQEVQFFKEKVTEALLVIKTDQSVLEQLKEVYASLKQSHITDLQSKLDRGLQRFDRAISKIEKDLHLEISRLETLVQVIEDRRELVS
jgi:hypothetical protein